jgi:phage terminase large subunit-like protein
VPFDKEKAENAAKFFELILKHSADEWWGQPFLLCPWEEEALSKIFGTVDDDGNRLIEQVYLETPKKSGKTEWAAGIALLVLMITTTPGCQVYGAAAATRQAMNVYRAACKMVEQHFILRRELRIMRGTNRILKRRDPDSFYAAVAADGDFGDGVNPLCTVADEVHRWKTRKQLENWDVLTKGGITRRQTLTIAITTAGIQDESPLAWKLHEKTRKISEGIIQDDRFYGRIYGAAATDDPADPATWIKANPSLIENGGFLDKEKIRREYESAVAEGDLTSFKRYFLNIWDQKENRAIDLNQWDACRMPFRAAGLLEMQPGDKVRPIPHDLLAHFIERKCWAGIDLSLTTDLSAVVFLFPDEIGFEVLPFFWTPADLVRQRQIKDGMPYMQWARDGFIELSPGSTIARDDIRKRLEWGASMFNVQNFCFDPHDAAEMMQMMIDDGKPVLQIKQGLWLSEPSKKLLEMIVAGTIAHGGHPVLRWNASCVSTKWRNDLMCFTKPERHTSTSRIDGISATVDALQPAIAEQANPAPAILGAF